MYENYMLDVFARNDARHDTDEEYNTASPCLRAKKGRLSVLIDDEQGTGDYLCHYNKWYNQFKRVHENRAKRYLIYLGHLEGEEYNV